MDPNGWVQNPPSTFVQVHGTSRETLNGQYALVLEYRAPRYNVVCAQSPTSVVALKPENLRAVTNFVEKMKAQYEMMKHNPQIQAQFQQVRDRIRSTTGLEVPYVAAILLLSLILSIWFLGFTKTMFVLSTLLLVGAVIGPDLGRQPWRTVLANAPMRWKQIIRTQIPKIGPTIADNRLYYNLFTVAVVAFILYSLLITPGGRTGRGSISNSRRLDHHLPDDMLLTRQKREEFYKMGFDDAANQREYGFSLPKAVDTPIPPALDDDPDIDALDFDGDVNPPKKKNPFSMSTALAVFTLYRTLVPLAQRADDGRFDLQLLRANLSTLEVWKLGLIGFSVYRIVSAFM